MKVSIVVPIRNREEMRKPFEDNVKKYYSKYDYEIIYVYQDDDTLFKVAQLRNIGFMNSNAEYIIYRDIDVLDLSDIDIEKWYIENGPCRTYTKRQNLNILHDRSYQYVEASHYVPGFGGYVILKKEDFINKNGFPNLCIGWGYEDDIIKMRYNLKEVNRTFGHILHPTNEDFNNIHVQTNQETYNLYKNKKIDHMLDGYKQLRYNLIYEKTYDNIRELHVNNIGVCEDFAYMDIIKKHKE